MRILYITPVPYKGAGSRYRIYQYLPYLSERGIRCSISPFLFSPFFNIVYKRGRFISKILFFIISSLKRVLDLFRALTYDVIIIYRESFPFGPPVFEYLLHLLKKKIIFDFDDAIFLTSSSDTNKMLIGLRRAGNAKDIIKMSQMVIAGNSYLQDYALRFNPNACIIPTAIDTEKFVPIIRRNNKKVVIGWIGTNSTQNYLILLKEVFGPLLSKYPDIEIRIIGAQGDGLGLNRVVYKGWLLEEEVSDIQSFDIGIMPLSDTDWAKGKCGFKIIQYMACGIPAVASAIGANKEIIQDGVNGFIASNEQEWLQKLSLLIEEPEVRQRLGMAGRKTAEERYSLKINAPKLLEVLLKVYDKKYGK